MATAPDRPELLDTRTEGPGIAPGALDTRREAPDARSGSPRGRVPSSGRAEAGPAALAVRQAVRRELAMLREPGPVLVACSGGADSLALAGATAWVAGRLGRPAGLITVDHGLQDGSSRRAADVAGWARTVGFDPVRVATVDVSGLPGGPEAAAREARYAALSGLAREYAAAAVLLGHTRDDQAETVLLALARGAGPRGLAGMPRRRDLDGTALLRPLLDVARADTRAACAELGLSPWEDPHNTDPGYARARVRADALPALVAALGPAVVANLARSAELLAADTAALDDLAAEALLAAAAPPQPPVPPDPLAAVEWASGGGLSVAALAGLSGAVRTRVLHRWARQLGAPGAALSHRHVAALDALVVDWRGQGVTRLPGGIGVRRRGGSLVRVPADPSVPSGG